MFLCEKGTYERTLTNNIRLQQLGLNSTRTSKSSLQCVVSLKAIAVIARLFSENVRCESGKR